MTSKTAVIDPKNSLWCTTADGVRMGVADAQALGHIVLRDHASTAPSKLAPLKASPPPAVQLPPSFVSQVLALPEALGRHDAAVALAADGKHSLPSIKSLLRGLPTDEALVEQDSAMDYNVMLSHFETYNNRLRMGAKRGDEVAAARAAKLGAAIDAVKASRGAISMEAALTNAGMSRAGIQGVKRDLTNMIHNSANLSSAQHRDEDYA